MEKTDSITSTENASFEEYEAVRQALQPYIAGAKSGDGASVRPVFLDHAHVLGSMGGSLSNMDADQFSEAVTQLGSSPAVRHQIAWIDISGSAAAAKVEFADWSGFRFTDFFVLFKHEGQWKISGKVFDSHSKS